MLSCSGHGRLGATDSLGLNLHGRLGYRSPAMATRHIFLIGLGGLALLAAGCRDAETGPIEVSAIGGRPELANPNLKPLDPPSAFLVESVAQGLVRFDAAGEIEPALAQRWIVSDDGLRYTFRLARLAWPDGRQITAQQVAARLRAAASGASRNKLKPLLGAIDEVEPMIAEVLEISLKSPRPNFLQLLAQPEMAVIQSGRGSGPFQFERQADGSVRLRPRPSPDQEEEEEAPVGPEILLRGEPAALAVARFDEGMADMVTGGSLGDLALARASGPPGNSLVFDPVSGMLGLAFTHRQGAFADPELRRALAMAIDRAAIVQAFAVPAHQPRESLVSPGVTELPQPALAAWSAQPLPLRRREAARIVAGAEEKIVVRVAMPEGPGYRLLFAHLKRDWAVIGVTAQRVGPREQGDLRLIDEVAPVNLATWYLRHFTCEASAVCDPAADEKLAAARIARNAAERRGLLAEADRALTDLSVYIPIAAPVRWSLVAPRLNGFRPNAFGRHPAGELLRPAP